MLGAVRRDGELVSEALQVLQRDCDERHGCDDWCVCFRVSFRVFVSGKKTWKTKTRKKQKAKHTHALLDCPRPVFRCPWPRQVGGHGHAATAAVSQGWQVDWWQEDACWWQTYRHQGSIGKQPKKPRNHRFRPGTVALREIRKYQKALSCSCASRPFAVWSRKLRTR